MHRPPLPTAALFCLAALTAGAAAFAAGPSAGTPAAPPSDAERLAAALGTAPSRLAGLIRGDERLADGRVLTSIKALDLDRGEIVGRSFLAGQPVDADAVRRQADDLWRFAHGAQSPALVERLQALAPQDRLVVDLWYVFTPPDDGGGPTGGVEQAPDTGLDAGPGQAAVRVGDDGKIEHLPEPVDSARRIQAELERAAAGAPALASVDTVKPADQVLDVETETQRKAEALQALATVEAANQERIGQLRTAMAPVRAAMVQRLVDAGWTVIHASDLVPSIVAEASRVQVETAARWPGVGVIEPETRNAGPSLNVARAAHNAVPLNAVGYDGTGVTVAVVEGARVYSQNPFLPVAQTRDATVAEDNHSMGVAGVIRSSHSTHRGMAPAATLISADGQYNVAGVLETATDWAAARAQVLNHSWGFKEQGNGNFNAFDRRLDHIGRYSFRLNVHAAGNHGDVNCGQSAGNVNTVFGVESPGRGFNTLTVGGFDDGGTIQWPNDVRYRCSANGWPTGDAGGTHQKPEIAAGAVAITSLARTTSSTTPLSGAWNGTSFASPAIAGIAANLMEADAQLAGSPVATRALMMVGAIHAPAETRAVSATASTFATEVGPWWFQGVDATSFPRSYNVYARAGQRVRFAIAWLSNVTLSGGVYSNDRLPADLDLRAYRADGTTLVASSTSFNNAFEIVDFTAPATETYEFRVSQFGTWTGGATPFAAAARLDGYLLPRGTWWNFGAQPRPQGRFFDIRPAQEYSGNTIYWRGVSLRPATGDYDLELYDSSWFLGPETNDTYNRLRLAASTFGGAGVDFIMVDGNHWPSSKREHYRVFRFSGSGGHSVNAANFVSIGASSGGLYGPYTMDANTSLFVVDLGISADSLRRVKLLPVSGGGDLGLAMYRSDSANSATWARSRGQSVAVADAAGAGGIEAMRYQFDGTGPDWLGLAVYNKTPGTTPQFRLRIRPSSLFSDGYDGD